MSWWLLCLASCVRFPDPADLIWDPWTADDVGEVCLWTGQEAFEPFLHAQEFVPGGPVQALAAACLSGSCDRNGTLELSVLEEDETLVLRSRLDWERVRPVERLVCTSDCRSSTASVTLPPLDEGTHEIVFGDQTMTVQVPGIQWACFDRVVVPQ